MPLLESLVLKEIFWTKIFGEKVQPKAMFGKDRLESMAKFAIAHYLADPVERKAT